MTLNHKILSKHMFIPRERWGRDWETGGGGPLPSPLSFSIFISENILETLHRGCAGGVPKVTTYRKFISKKQVWKNVSKFGLWCPEKLVIKFAGHISPGYLDMWNVHIYVNNDLIFQTRWKLTLSLECLKFGVFIQNYFVIEH